MAASLSQCNQGDSKNERQFALHPLHTLLLIINVDLQLGRSRCVAIILQKKPRHLQLLLHWNDGSFFNDDFARRRAEAPPLLWFV